jgi:hypothetical protein
VRVFEIAPNVKGVAASGGICLFVAGLKLYGSIEFQKPIYLMSPPLQKHFVSGRSFVLSGESAAVKGHK